MADNAANDMGVPPELAAAALRLSKGSPDSQIFESARAYAMQKPAGWRAEREPDASWYRPSTHRLCAPGLEAEPEPSEEEKREKCGMQQVLYDMMEARVQKEPWLIDEANEQIESLNDYFKKFGCPEFPKFQYPSPMFSKNF